LQPLLTEKIDFVQLEQMGNTTDKMAVKNFPSLIDSEKSPHPGRGKNP
jgi:hypothetical protein